LIYIEQEQGRGILCIQAGNVADTFGYLGS
jgi:hypothetical protein